MRDDLFRGKRKDNGKWVIGYYFCMHHNDGRTHIHHFIIPIDVEIPKDKPIGEIQVEVIPETVGQYTGLTDKKDKRIWKDDYCKLTRNGVLAYGVIKRIKGCFFFVEDTRQWEPSMVALYSLEDNNFEIEVISNVHDNPELLGEVTE